MLLTERQTEKLTTQGEAAAGFRLRVLGDSVSEQLFELPVGKTTIGSSPKCTYRIQLPGVQPLHLLIVQEGGELSVRRWAIDATLNGESFEEAQLRSGDWLSVGSMRLEIEVVDPPKSDQRDDSSANSPEERPFAAWDAAWGHPFQATGNISVPKALGEESWCQAEHKFLDYDEQHIQSESLQNVESGVPSDELCGVPVDQCARLICQSMDVPATSPSMENVDADEERQQLEWTREREDWVRQRADVERRLAESEALSADCLRRIEHLEQEWKASQFNQGAAQPDSDLPDELEFVRASGDSSPPAPTQSPATGPAEPFSAAGVYGLETDHIRNSSTALPTDAFDWSTVRNAQPPPTADAGSFVGAVEPIERDASNQFAVNQHSGAPEIQPERVSPPGEDFEFPPAKSENPWHNETSSSVREGTRQSAGEYYRPADVAQQGTKGEFEWPGGSPAEPGSPLNDDISPFAEFSIWNQGSPSTQSILEGRPSESLSAYAGTPSQSWDAQAGIAVAAGDIGSAVAPQMAPPPERMGTTPEVRLSQFAEAPRPAAQPSSFIERFAGMFEDDAETSLPQTTATSRPPDGGVQAVRPAEAGVEAAPLHDVQTDDEESIEQYMAKLLQRVRGESSSAPATPTLPAQEMNASPGNFASTVPSSNIDEHGRPTNGGSALGRAEASGDRPTTSTESIRPREPIAKQTADMRAFRAVANETARRAIGTHAMHKHRRDAMTKTIVATLAGMTSIFLMLDAPSWLDLQFIAACVSLLVAAYWAGQTFGTLMESFRAAAYDGPNQLNDDLGDPFRPALPIDVEP